MTGNKWHFMGRKNTFRNNYFYRILLIVCSIILSAITVQAKEIGLSATVDKTELTLEDSVNLSVIVKGVKDYPPIHLPPIDGFKVHSRGSSSAIQIINGDMKSLVRHSYLLTPNKLGKTVIGSIKLALNDKTYSTDPITLNVKEAIANKSKGESPAYIEATVSNEQPYLNEEVTYTIRLFQKVKANILGLKNDLKDFRQEDLGKPKRFNRVINGIEYLVTDFSSAIFPIKTGHLEISPAILEIELIYRERGRRSNDPFDIFNNGPFSNRRIKTEHKVLRSQKIDLNVQPLPEKNKPADFSNLIGQFNFSASLSKPKIEVGDTSTLTVKISGQGNIKDVEFNLPDLSSQFKVYPDRPEFKPWVQNNRISGQKIYNFALVPPEDGIKQVPPFTLSFFDPAKKDYVTISSKPLQLTVIPSKSGETFKVVEAKPKSNTPSVKILGKDIFPIHTKLGDFKSDNLNNNLKFGYTAALLTPILFFIGATYLNRHREQLKNDSAFSRNRIAFKQAKQQLDELSASSINDQKYLARELSRILREYIGNKINLQGNAFTSHEVESKLKGNIFKDDQVLSTKNLLEKYEAMQFSPDTNEKHDKLIDESRDIFLQLEKQV